ncbi:hypothetical protein MRBLRH13_000211 [Agrobacterium radiobacter]|uniref:hypothetical protein n=1 Tax=Agrobacterium radiobacter TaxID=362 RepID=UPI0034145C19
MTGIPGDILKAAEEALDNMLCNCRESCGGTNEGLRAASIADIARAIMAEREAHIAKMDEVCSVSFADHNAASELLREFTGTEGGVTTVDWYALRDRIADATSMARVDERYKCRFALSEAEKREKEARAKALEEALKPFAEYMGDHFDKDNHGKPLPDDLGVGWIYLTHADFRRARQALASTGGEHHAE